VVAAATQNQGGTTGGNMPTLAPGEVVTDLSKVPPVYRGGKDLTPGEGQVKSLNGKINRGTSLNFNPTGLDRFGGAYRIKSLPEGLGIAQRGPDLGHFEIVSTRQMDEAEYLNLLKKVVFYE
jgi:hypothetical protein